MAIVQPAQKTKNWLLLWFNLNTTYLPRIDTTYSFIDKPWKSLFFPMSIQYNMYLCLLFPKLHSVHQRSSQVHFFRTTKLHINYYPHLTDLTLMTVNYNFTLLTFHFSQLFLVLSSIVRLWGEWIKYYLPTI